MLPAVPDHDQLVNRRPDIIGDATPESFRCDRKALHPFNIVNCVKYLSAVIPQPTNITDADRNAFKDDESLLVLKSLPVNFLGANGSLAVFAEITIPSFLSGIC